MDPVLSVLLLTESLETLYASCAMRFTPTMDKESEIAELPVTLTYLLLVPLVVISLFDQKLALDRLVAEFV